MPEASARHMVLDTPLGDSLIFQSMTGSEEMSRLFEYQVTALSLDPDISADDLLGLEAKVSMQLPDDTTRWYCGVVTGFGIDGVSGRYHRYRLTLRPWLWLLTRSSNLRIFQNKSALEIITDVFGAYANNFESKVSATLATRPYCVQYRETDFDFVSRLLEEEGISYHFSHNESGHKLVLCDTVGEHTVFPGFDEVRFFDRPGEQGEIEAIHEWRMSHEIQPGKFVLRDFNFETPSTDLTSTLAASTRSHGQAEHEVYDYPGLYAVKADGDARAEVRRDEAQSRFARFTGQGRVPGLAAGHLFTLVDHPRADQNVEYIVLRTQIELQVAGYEAGAESDASHATDFKCQFLAQPSAEPLRPARITPKPAVAGPQTAIVVGDADPGDILTDEYGRVKLQFHWDRLGEKNANSSCWVRVASPSAGDGWGMISLPRIGQEVVVDFLEGDPDQPLVTGRVHNAEQRTPYELPANATVSTWKSRTKLGGAAQFNEIRFQDLDGSEYMLLHAQKDRFEFVEDSLKSKIDQFEHRTVLKDRKEKIEGEHHLQVLKDVKVKYGMKYHLYAAQAMQFETGDKFNLKSGADASIESGAKISVKSGADLHIKIGSNLGADAAQNVHIKAGMNVVIEGGMQVSIKAGGSSVVLGPDGVSITGAMVKINSGGSAGSGGGASPTAPTAPDAPVDPEVPEDPLSHR